MIWKFLKNFYPKILRAVLLLWLLLALGVSAVLTYSQKSSGQGEIESINQDIAAKRSGLENALKTKRESRECEINIKKYSDLQESERQLRDKYGSYIPVDERPASGIESLLISANHTNCVDITKVSGYDVYKTFEATGQRRMDYLTTVSKTSVPALFFNNMFTGDFSDTGLPFTYGLIALAALAVPVRLANMMRKKLFTFTSQHIRDIGDLPAFQRSIVIFLFIFLILLALIVIKIL
ncbi:MAG: hypothetical protein A3I31_00505 [Candidatus Colwellbacteria bacterium RIFCSPLOWO2_02_FULL_44_20b]|uniref:Uncharacterized protein n=1 Tax=Candidatus Colwellbacteria bacterium RIFCSPLOWO2_02_FULL_44_20b TaxID=1797691 RepID=A0A1G1Z5C4_9BACT|nr:MAG: hypothetical protein A3I31_00505 [Candidatus Colwellbacteria bacterium RIFCSPLOWO2_02_FULL_44_20b]